MTWSTLDVAVCCSSDLEFPRALLLRLEQPHVLDCYYRLISEGRHQLDVLFGKRVHLIAGEREDADRLSVTQERHAEDGSVSPSPYGGQRSIRSRPERPRYGLALPSNKARPVTLPRSTGRGVRANAARPRG